MHIKYTSYLLNCFLLLIPIFLWNIIFAAQLPEAYQAEVFWKDIPPFIAYGENSLRIIIFILPAFLLISFKTTLAKTGWSLYLIGTILYFGSWVIPLYFSDNTWSQNPYFFMAPAYTTIIWLVGIGLIGHKAFIKIPYISFFYILLSFTFVSFHSWHAWLVFSRL